MVATIKKHGRSGQALLMSVIMMGGALLGAAAIAGVLMLFQVRQANNAADSARALFAADAGLEWRTYCVLKDPNYPGCSSDFFPIASGASAQTNVEYVSSTIIRIVSDGGAGESVRTLESTFRFVPSGSEASSDPDGNPFCWFKVDDPETGAGNWQCVEGGGPPNDVSNPECLYGGAIPAGYEPNDNGWYCP